MSDQNNMKHTLLRPLNQIAVAWDRTSQIIMQFLINIHQ